MRWPHPTQLNVAAPLFAYGSLALLLAHEITGVTGRSLAFTNATAPVAPPPSPLLFLAWAMVTVSLAWAGWLAPRTVAPTRRPRHLLGHAWLAVVNAAVLATVALPLLIAQLPGLSAIGHLLWIGIPVTGLALLAWPVGLLLVWAARGRPDDPSAGSSAPGPRPPTAPKAAESASAPWRVGHQGRDMMYYEEHINGRWERLALSGEMLMGPAHHVIYFASEADWQRHPAWAQGRRDQIIARIRAAFPPPDYEHQGA